MIGLLRGNILQKQAPELLLDVGGVGYELLASLTTFIDLPEIDNEVTLYTHLIVREDAHTLYAFSSVEERALFRTLLKVNGVGPKMALAIVSGMTANEFSQRVHANDVAGLTKLPGVGKKTAERLIIEMRDRLPEPSAQLEADVSIPVSARNMEDEATAALLALGYKPTHASQMVSKYSSDGLSVEEIVRKALKASLS
ncbi:Holliday junction branch migration protein RuvA [Cocleimonas sp. KMM 6892]|uniref:Holliday junction branch migration protein RuvA n=1 Tax=unclassified Cocleimonas TaxID=2639732 RepID=UPI002DBA169C|nr:MULTISPECIES: Holliday junction branch migration protein RuvA [unclassified Cocleimonas]MEB8431243.1 Holliday junction branch migration protein RuvA [Cocleimonas sp. KMM 6892]MEC4713985.1 Holliday junction branch migration protein RuvA [Cocleimonas sp. KMM 6895]MEC4743316.1 Holliday junction branch migration protein RuvA [Cocleimonas sp. KMM 6896]